MAESAPAEIDEEALGRLKEILDGYDAQAARLHEEPQERQPRG
ncbi:hypothetical protein [Streptomyces sp. URMC 124]